MLRSLLMNIKILRIKKIKIEFGQSYGLLRFNLLSTNKIDCDHFMVIFESLYI